MSTNAFVICAATDPPSWTRGHNPKDCWSVDILTEIIGNSFVHPLEGTSHVPNQMVEGFGMHKVNASLGFLSAMMKPKHVVYIWIPPCSHLLELALSLSMSLAGRDIRGRIRVDRRLAHGSCASADVEARIQMLEGWLPDLVSRKAGLSSPRGDMLGPWAAGHFDIAWLDKDISGGKSSTLNMDVLLGSLGFTDGKGLDKIGHGVIAEPLAANQFIHDSAREGDKTEIKDGQVFCLTGSRGKEWTPRLVDKFKASRSSQYLGDPIRGMASLSVAEKAPTAGEAPTGAKEGDDDTALDTDMSKYKNVTWEYENNNILNLKTKPRKCAEGKHELIDKCVVETVDAIKSTVQIALDKVLDLDDEDEDDIDQSLKDALPVQSLTSLAKSFRPFKPRSGTETFDKVQSVAMAKVMDPLYIHWEKFFARVCEYQPGMMQPTNMIHFNAQCANWSDVKAEDYAFLKSHLQTDAVKMERLLPKVGL